MSKGKAWQVPRRERYTDHQWLEYVGHKPILWAREEAERHERQRAQRLTTEERIRFKHWLFWKYGSECGYCKRVIPLEALTIDHIQPRSKGGLVRDVRNMVLACLGCNRAKGNSWTVYTTC